MPIDLGEGIYQGLSALANGLQARKQREYEQELLAQKQAQQSSALNQLLAQFQRPETVPSQPSYARPDPAGGVRQMSQPTQLGGVGNLQTGAAEGTIPDMGNPGLLQALMQAQQAGVNTDVFTNLIKGNQPQFDTIPDATTWGERRGATFTPRGRTPDKQTSSTDRQNPNEWLADSLEPSLSPEQRGLAKKKYDAYVSSQGEIAGVRTEASKPFNLQDRKVHSYTGKDNKNRYVWQRPDGSTYETLSQDEAATTEIRNKQSARDLALNSINEIEKLSQRVITEKTGILQKAKASGRAASAALANDPDFRTYQDARMALAGNLAVLQQGSRPSDADIKAIWLPLVPDVFSDTKDSKTQKWALIKVMALGKQSGEQIQDQPSGTQTFNVNGETFIIPDGEVDEFKREMGIK